MMKILVPVDFSGHTEISCRYAISIAAITGAEVILFHSFFDQLYFSDGGMNTGFESGIMLTDEIITDFYSQKEKMLNQLAESLGKLATNEDHPGIRIKSFMESGDPEVQIANFIRESEPDVIVMGSGGMGKKGLLSGSVARHVIDKTEIPVIAVPDIREVPSLHNVLYMTAFDKADAGIIARIDELLANFRINVHCLHLLNGEKKDPAEQKMDELSASRQIRDLGNRVFFHILENKSQRDCLNGFIKTHGIGLIAFIPHKRNIFSNIFYQGITREDLFQTQIPIMAIKPVQP